MRSASTATARGGGAGRDGGTGVREAIRVLEAHGVLRSEVGSGRGAGTFVAALPGLLDAAETEENAS